MVKRIIRLNEQLKRDILQILRYEVADPRVAGAAVTAVEASPDLMQARVFVSVMADEEEQKETLAGLSAAAPFIRSQLAQRLEIRRIPELEFQLDRTLERGTRIEELLEQVRPAEGWAEDEAADDDADA